MTGHLPLYEEPRRAIWRRRAVSIPGLFVLTALYLAAMPLLLVVSIVRDLARRARFAMTRFVFALAGNLVVHSATLVWLFASWVLHGRWVSDSERVEAAATYGVEIKMARLLMRIVERAFSMRRIVEGADELGAGPVFVFARHVSLIDSILFLAVAGDAGLRLRYLAKRELLWDPCIDVLGHRVPFAFVWRGRSHHTEDVGAVAHLVEALGPGDAVLAFPEGTRFSEEKQRKQLALLEKEQPALAALASTWRHVLPPHPSGCLALLEHDDEADVVLCAHTGLEGASHLKDALAGSLIGRELRVRFWRIRREDIPRDHEEARRWLFERFADVEQWVERNRARDEDA